MKAHHKIIPALGFIALIFTGCWSELYEAHLSTAVVNENYSFQLGVDDNDWDWGWDNNYYLFSQTGGRLPNGTYLTSSGAIVGTPTETGNFIFWVTMHDIDDNYFSDDEIYSDSNWYTLFVTENSTNTNCPKANDENTTEIYICGGELETTTLEEESDLDLDINLFVDRDRAQKYAIEEIDFTISYDPTYFAIDPELLSSLLLREAATRVDATVEYDLSREGEIRVIITSHGNTLHKSGRIIDIPFYTLTAVPAGTHNFTITINDMISTKDNVDWPQQYEVDGKITVTEDTTEVAEPI